MADASKSIAVVGLVFMFALARSRGIYFELGRVLLAGVLHVPFRVAFGAIGALWTSWRPRCHVLLTGVAVMSYFIQEVTLLYGWPD